MEYHKDTKEIVRYTVRMPKDYSSFFYFTLEANENIAFYSTLEAKKGQQFRDVIVSCTPELEQNLIKIIDHCSKNSNLEILSREIIPE